MAQIRKLMVRLQFGLQFNTVRRRPGRTDQGRWSSMNGSGPRRPELLMRLGHAAHRVVQRRPPTRWSLTAEMTAMAPHNDSPGPTATVARNKVAASHQVAALN